jgi:hypothetical protein
MAGAGAAWIPLKDNLALFSNFWLNWFNWHKLDRAVWRDLDRSRRSSLFGSANGAGDIGLGHAGRATRHFTSPPQHLIQCSDGVVAREFLARLLEPRTV